MTTQPFGDRAVLRFTTDPLSLAEALRCEFPEAEVRAGLDAVLVEFANPGEAPPDLVDRVSAITPREAAASDTRVVDIAVTYDGADLPGVAEQLGLDPAAVIDGHCGIRWRVAMLGFAPGFPYLVPNSADPNPFIGIARLASPRSRVPAGSVAVAAGMCCIYPSVLPGGWQLLGRTDVRLFDAGSSPPSLLLPGDVVRFRPIK